MQHSITDEMEEILIRIIRIDEGSSQNLILFIRGEAMADAPNINGVSQFSKPQIMNGITMKKIIMKAGEVRMEL